LFIPANDVAIYRMGELKALPAVPLIPAEMKRAGALLIAALVRRHTRWQQATGDVQQGMTSAAADPDLIACPELAGARVMPGWSRQIDRRLPAPGLGIKVLRLSLL